MAMLKYLRNKDGLLDPRGSLSTVMPARTISSANKAVRDTHEYNDTSYTSILRRNMCEARVTIYKITKCALN